MLQLRLLLLLRLLVLLLATGDVAASAKPEVTGISRSGACGGGAGTGSR